MRMWRYIIDKLCMVDESDIDRSVYTVVEMIDLHWTINWMKPCLRVLPPCGPVRYWSSRQKCDWVVHEAEQKGQLIVSWTVTEYVVRDICFQLSNNIVKGTACELKWEEVNDEYTDCLVTRKSDLVCLQILTIHRTNEQNVRTRVLYISKVLPSLRSCYLACTYSTWSK